MNRPIGSMRLLWLAAGLLLAGIGIVGLILPVMPGTVFLILALACFSRSSPRLESWLLNHRAFGPALRQWRSTGAIPGRAKALAVSMMAGSLTVMGLVGTSGLTIAVAAAPMAAAAVFILTRP
jgi:uncharacterized membrane protein YbaN (DUF454 family)